MTVTVTDGFAQMAPAELEGLSDKHPKGQGFCGFSDPVSELCVSHACIPGNQETLAVPQIIGRPAVPDLLCWTLHAIGERGGDQSARVGSNAEA
jgi:hypothetical protein